MEQKTISKRIAKGIVSTLNIFLKMDANSTTCIFAYQPKAPEELKRFRRKK